MNRALYLPLISLCVLALTAGQSNASALDDPGSRVAASGAGGSGGLIPVVEETDAGAITIGANAQVVMRFRNESSKDVKISQIDLYPSSTVSAEIALDECTKQPLPSGSECALVVGVKGLKTGNWRVEALLRHDGKSRIMTSAMKGTVEAGEESSDKLLSDVEAFPDEIDFGSMTSSRPLVKSVVLRNVTSTPLEFTKISVQPEQSGYTFTSECKKLNPGEACAVAITWAPFSKGKGDGVLIAEHTGSTKVVSVDIKGEFNPDEVETANIYPEAVPGLGLLVSSQDTLDFGTVDNEASITTSLVNVGDADLAIQEIKLGGVENGLTISRNGCKIGTILKPVEACPLTLSWSPVRGGAIIDDAQIRHTGARGVLVLPIRGTASAAINKDTKAVIVEGAGMVGAEPIKPADKSQALEGFIITSHSPKRAIINGPGGSRVVSDGQQLVLGGIQWDVDITPNGVDFISGRDKIRLLFDRSLSSVNRTSSQSSGASGSGNSSSSASGSSSAPAAPSAPTAQ